jgi:hypothetical protein
MMIMKKLKVVVASIFLLGCLPASETEIMVCMTRGFIVVAGATNTLECTDGQGNTSPNTLGKLYKNGWKLIEVVTANVEGEFTIIYLEKE